LKNILRLLALQAKASKLEKKLPNATVFSPSLETRGVHVSKY
jgi:hypothetical protein